jgi:hypothetical protein
MQRITVDPASEGSTYFDPPATTLAISFAQELFGPPYDPDVNVFDLMQHNEQLLPYVCSLGKQTYFLTGIVYSGVEHFMCSFLVPDRVAKPGHGQDSYSWHYYDDLTVKDAFKTVGRCSVTHESQFGKQPPVHPIKFAAECYLADNQNRKAALGLAMAVYTCTGTIAQVHVHHD